MATTEPLERAAPALADPLDRAADARDAERVEAVIGGGEPIAGRLDALRILDGMLDMLEPRAVAGESLAMAAELVRIALGRSAVELPPRDKRFADPAWAENPLYHRWAQAYLAWVETVDRLSTTPRLKADWKREARARFSAALLTSTIAPTNLLAGNPAALKRAFDTGGGSLVAGARQFLDDVRNNGGRPRQVDASGFEVGRNLAVTPAKVVFRNHLMELLQYEPQTEQVHATPLLASPPWINKYYVMDLAPGRSFIEWAVQHGRTVFAISYINPTADMASTTMDDYLIHGPQTALDVISDITGAETIDIVGLCLGGALTAVTAAYLQQAGDSRVGALTLINTMLDYAEPGALGTFTDLATVEKLERKMRREGTLEGASMAGTFDILRANDLIFNYVVSNWLMGQKPPAFDILAWNADSTRMPAAMHAFYLRNFYIENKPAKGTLETAGRTVDLGVIKSPTYIVSAINDHIVPWETAYKSVGLVSGPARFVLGSGGHIAGIVAPPGPKVWHMTGAENVASAKEWREGAERVSGSWWEDWATWSAEHSGEMVDPPRLGSDAHPVLGDGPGEYVRT